jgi:hypothetical protein
MVHVSELYPFVEEVDRLVKENYGVDDGGDLCHNLIAQLIIDMKEGPVVAARIVAQCLLQP